MRSSATGPKAVRLQQCSEFGCLSGQLTRLNSCRDASLCLPHFAGKRDILEALDLEDTPKDFAPFAIERSRGAT